MYVDTSLAFAAELKLRTLDLLHVAHLLALKEGGSHVEALAYERSESGRVREDTRPEERFIRGRTSRHVEGPPVVLGIGAVDGAQPRARGDVAAPQAPDQRGAVPVVHHVVLGTQPAPVAVDLHYLLREQGASAGAWWWARPENPARGWGAVRQAQKGGPCSHFRGRVPTTGAWGRGRVQMRRVRRRGHGFDWSA
jgi:hypothetical protein